MSEAPQPNQAAQPSPSEGRPASLSLILEWQYNGQLLHVILKDMSRDTVNLWVDTVSPIMKDWPRSKTFRLWYDATDPRVSLTPYLRTKLAEFAKVSGGLEGRVALLLPRSFVAQMVQLFLRTQRHPGIETRIFFSRDEALAWTAAGLERLQS